MFDHIKNVLRRLVGATAPVEKPSEDLNDDIEFCLDEVVERAMTSVDAPLQPMAGPMVDDGGPASLFADIAATYCQPIKDFVTELREGTATHEWIEMCMPIMGSIIEGAESLELHDVAARMVLFRDALSEVESCDRSKRFDEASSRTILERYDALVEALPATFEVEGADGDTSDRRDSIIVHSLLRQVPDVGRVTLEKLYAAGLNSLATLYLANPGDMSAATGVPGHLCKRICARISDHRQELDGCSSNEDAQRTYRKRLTALLTELHRLQQDLRRISNGARAAADSGAAKRECMRLRQECSLQIEVLLAEMGEVQLVKEVRKLGIEPRIVRLEQYLNVPATGGESSVTVPQRSPEE